jgi:hypothetical protein
MIFVDCCGTNCSSGLGALSVVDVGRGKRDAVELTVGLIPRRDFRRSYMRSPRGMRQGIPLVAVL